MLVPLPAHHTPLSLASRTHKHLLRLLSLCSCLHPPTFLLLSFDEISNCSKGQEARSNVLAERKRRCCCVGASCCHGHTLPPCQPPRSVQANCHSGCRYHRQQTRCRCATKREYFAGSTDDERAWRQRKLLARALSKACTHRSALLRHPPFALHSFIALIDPIF